MIELLKNGPVATLRLNHGRVSALDLELCRALREQVDALRDSPVEAVVLTGTGSAFCAGVDLHRVLAGGSAYLREFMPAMEACFEALLTFPKPLVGAINGHAIAGGCIIAATCDYAVLADGNARLGLTELAVGVPFPVLPLEIVRARVQEPGLHELILGAGTVLPARALELGLVHEVAPAPDVLPRAMAHAERLAAIPRVAFSLTKRSLVAPVLDRVRAARDIDAAVTAAWESPDVLEPVRRYMEGLKK